MYRKEKNGYSVYSLRHMSIKWHVAYSKMLKRWICNCPDFRYRRMDKGENCKHINEVIEGIEEMTAKKKGSKKKHTKNTQMRVSKASLPAISAIAKQLFKIYTTQHKKLNIRVPSNRVAIDYMLVTASEKGQLNVPKLDEKNNLYLAIADQD